ncbi:DnaJ-domain-containing protein [Suillus fuscotomentosus]|uniref:DnaJ-domain-containing protein n=1 Tax=Suillus fuscotomentosus TaxID=1912939 RepID=A0AAD4HSM8_9AGAM|nr:DnaJ-domain-containing protein [Suillus fuscotomentosus]KAG1907106.1 DnaJ-domain-containing protein [Suillus fuscotomentosus]
MKLFVFVAFLAVLVTVVSAWTKEDHEIFDLVTALEVSEGRGTTFYSWLDVPSTATLMEINKAYRKKSIQLHPDKNPGVKGIHERFARLGVIATILKNPEERKRYDFFYKNGVPKWRGSGYYYARFRPGLGTVLVFLTILTSGLQYLVQTLNYKRDLMRIELAIRDARLAAWGPKMEPLQGKRKVKVNLGGGARQDGAGNIVPGKMLDMVVEQDNVFILDPSGNLHILDTSSATPAAISRTWFIELLISSIRKFSYSKENSGNDVDNEPSVPTVDRPDSPVSGASEGEEPRQAEYAAAVKAGGRRRKAARKR